MGAKELSDFSMSLFSESQCLIGTVTANILCAKKKKRMKRYRKHLFFYPPLLLGRLKRSLIPFLS